MAEAIGLLETTGLTPALVGLDAMEKHAGVRIVQAEMNDFSGVCVKIAGPLDQVRTALEQGHAVAESLGGSPVSCVLANPDERSEKALYSKPAFSPLIQQHVVYIPLGDHAVAASTDFALGFIETQGFTAAFAAIDAACKAANVEVVGKEKLGGGYVTIVLKGDVAAVKAAIDAGVPEVEGLGKLVASYVIARPSQAVLRLLPEN